MGLGSCASFDVIAILKKQRQAIKTCECVLEAERADAVPAVFTKITMHFQVSGDNLMPEKSSEQWLCQQRSIALRQKCLKMQALN